MCVLLVVTKFPSFSQNHPQSILLILLKSGAKPPNQIQIRLNGWQIFFHVDDCCTWWHQHTDVDTESWWWDHFTVNTSAPASPDHPPLILGTCWSWVRTGHMLVYICKADHTHGGKLIINYLSLTWPSPHFHLRFMQQPSYYDALKANAADWLQFPAKPLKLILLDFSLKISDFWFLWWLGCVKYDLKRFDEWRLVICQTNF